MDNNAAVFRTEETLKQALTDIHALKERYSRITVHDKGNASTPTCWKPSSWDFYWSWPRSRWSAL